MSQHTQLSPLATKVHSIYKNMAQASPTPLVEIHAVRGGMLSISNPGKATKEQIQDSIPGEYELFFYLIKV